MIKRRKLSDEVQDRLLHIIQNGDLEPGDQLPSERQLMADFAVGRPAIREAMQNLQRMGLIEIRHGERPKVAKPSMEKIVAQMSQSIRHVLSHSEISMTHLKEARLTFEVEMASRAARQRSPYDIALLRKTVALQAASRDDSEGFTAGDGEFHRAIAAISGNPIFTVLAQSIFSWLAHFHIDMVRQEGMEDLTIQEHEAIIEAIERKDEDGAADAMARHLNRANKLYHQKYSV